MNKSLKEFYETIVNELTERENEELGKADQYAKYAQEQRDEEVKQYWQAERRARARAGLAYGEAVFLVRQTYRDIITREEE